MSDEQKSEQDGPEVAYPNSNPHPTPSPLPTDYSDPVDKQVEPSFVVTPGTESTEERREIAAERRDELGFPEVGGKANGVDESGDPDATEKADEADGETGEDDGEPELSDESDDDEPKLPADDSPIHGESTVKPDQADPTL